MFHIVGVFLVCIIIIQKIKRYLTICCVAKFSCFEEQVSSNRTDQTYFHQVKWEHAVTFGWYKIQNTIDLVTNIMKKKNQIKK